MFKRMSSTTHTNVKVRADQDAAFAGSAQFGRALCAPTELARYLCGGDQCEWMGKFVHHPEGNKLEIWRSSFNRAHRITLFTRMLRTKRLLVIMSFYEEGDRDDFDRLGIHIAKDGTVEAIEIKPLQPREIR